MSFIDLTNAPTPPRWFEFLLEPGRLQQHLETDKCDPSPSQLITLFLKNILSADMHETSDVSIPIPQDSFEAKYRHRKTDALQMLSLKVASYLGWDLDIICEQLTIPIQYGLMQAFVNVCSREECPVEVKGFAALVNCHWYIKSAIAYKLSTLEPQTSSTTMIYLSNLQQQQQAADHLSLMYMGEVLSDTSEQLRKYVVDLYDFIMKLVKGQGQGQTKKVKSSGHPFERAKLYRPTMDCFEPFGENDWTKFVPVDSLKLLEVACFDLGRYYFFEENYSETKKMFEIIEESSRDKFPLLKEYINSSIDMLAKTDEPDDTAPAITLTNTKRKQAEKYLFDCMTQYSKSLKSDDSNKKDVNGYANSTKATTKKDCDLRIERQNPSSGQQQMVESNPWYMQLPEDYHQQQLLELSRGDICMSQGDFEQAMGCYVSALMLMTDYFMTFSKNYLDEEPYITRMIQCSISLSCHTQAVALCQMTRSLNYAIAFKQLNERICNDCCDDIYECIWNVTLLEYIINLHARRGEVERRTKAIQLIGQLELNENNPEDVLREAEHVRRGRFFRIMSNKYL